MRDVNITVNYSDEKQTHVIMSVEDFKKLLDELRNHPHVVINKIEVK